MSWTRMISVFLVGVFCLPVSASALEIERSRPQLCSKADVVVIGEVTSSETVWEQGDNGGLLTRVWFARKLPVLGDTGDAAIELVLPGGIKGDLEHYVEDSPTQLQRDRRYLLILVESPRGGFQLLGGEAGAVPLNDSVYRDGERYLDAVGSVAQCR